MKFNYSRAYKVMHKRGAFAGRSLLAHVDEIKELVKSTRSRTLLDYGCGKGEQYREHEAHFAWGGIMPTLYDIGLPHYAHKPDKQFDGVICTDVMEHIAPEDVDVILREVIGYARKFAFFSISTRPAKKHFPNGRNVHLTVRPISWWIERAHAVQENDAIVRIVQGG